MILSVGIAAADKERKRLTDDGCVIRDADRWYAIDVVDRDRNVGSAAKSARVLRGEAENVGSSLFERGRPLELPGRRVEASAGGKRAQGKHRKRIAVEIGGDERE